MICLWYKSVNTLHQSGGDGDDDTMDIVRSIISKQILLYIYSVSFRVTINITRIVTT
jgi:hypothetical protein